MKHVVAHDLPEALARSTVEKALGSYRQKYPQATMNLAWVDERTANVQIGAKGFDVKGTLSIAPREIIFDMNVPLMLRPLQGKAMAVLDREVNVWIEKARAEQSVS